MEETYNDDLQLFYNNPLKKPLYKRYVKKVFSFIKSPNGNIVRVPHPKIIYGHYCLDDFKKFYVKPECKTGAFFRDPIEWVGSYLFYNQHKGSQAHTGDVIQDIKSLKLDKAFNIFLGGLSVEDMDFVGILEEYEKSLNLFEEMFDVQLSVKHINKTKNSPMSYKESFIQQGILKDVQDLMAENSKIYTLALERFKILSSNNQKNS